MNRTVRCPFSASRSWACGDRRRGRRRRRTMTADRAIVLGADRIGEEAGERRLAGARRTPQDQSSRGARERAPGGADRARRRGAPGRRTRRGVRGRIRAASGCAPGGAGTGARASRHRRADERTASWPVYGRRRRRARYVREVAPVRLPQLDLAALRVVDPREPAHARRVPLGVGDDLDPLGCAAPPSTPPAPSTRRLSIHCLSIGK